jgi:hypothetical protein
MGRRLSQKEMNMIKHDEEVYNSRVKRGEIEEKEGGRHSIHVCGCGATGCAFHAQAPHNPYPDSQYAYY